MLKWIAGIGGLLLAALKVVTIQRDGAREKAKQEQARAEALEAVREAEQRIIRSQAEQRQIAEQVQHEIDKSRNTRPDPDVPFGDSRLHNRKD